MADKGGGFWTSMPGILTGMAAVLTAAGGLVLAFRSGDAPVNASPTVAVATGVEQGIVGVDKNRVEPGQFEARNPIARADIPDNATVRDPDGWSNLRAGPSTDTAVVARIDEGTRLFVMSERDGWSHVGFQDGRTGYLHSSRLVRDR